MKRLCVFCGSSKGNNPIFAAAAVQLAKLLMQHNITLVNGGGSVGIMGVMANTMLEGGGQVIGIIPQFIVDMEVAHSGLTELHIVSSMHERKKMMFDLSDGFVALPGGLGTLEEIFEIVSWAQLKLHDKPCGFLNVAGYFDPLIQFLDEAVQKGFVRSEHRQMVLQESAPEKLLQQFLTYRSAHIEKLLEKVT